MDRRQRLRVDVRKLVTGSVHEGTAMPDTPHGGVAAGAGPQLWLSQLGEILASSGGKAGMPLRTPQSPGQPPAEAGLVLDPPSSTGWEPGPGTETGHACDM